jgi:hypothetical protein
LEKLSRKNGFAIFFALAVEDLRKLCELRERQKTFRLFEVYDLEGDVHTSYEELAQERGIPVTDVNEMRWLGRAVNSGRLRGNICGRFASAKKNLAAKQKAILVGNENEVLSDRALDRLRARAESPDLAFWHVGWIRRAKYGATAIPAR